MFTEILRQLRPTLVIFVAMTLLTGIVYPLSVSAVAWTLFPTPAAGNLIVKDGKVIGIMEPSKRTFPSRQSSTTEAALLTRGVSQLYLSLGDPNDDGSIAIRLYHKPLVLLIWLGAVVMFLGGALSLSDRRLRIGAPKPAKASKPAMQPAE